VLEVASVIGVKFPEWLLRELTGGDGVSDNLRVLEEAGILARCEVPVDGEGALGQPCWRFRHELFHDAAYGRLLSDRKRQLHAALADRMERAEPPVAAAELARHRMAAGDVGKALPVLERAAAEADAIGATAEAEAFRQAAASLRAGAAPASS
jgi:predicted ATPase